MRARHRVGHLLLRTGTRLPDKGRAWSRRYFQWLATIQFGAAARQAAFTDYCAEVMHHEARVLRLEAAIDEALTSASPKLKALYEALQGLIAAAELGGVLDEVGHGLPEALAVPLPHDRSGRRHGERNRVTR